MHMFRKPGTSKAAVAACVVGLTLWSLVGALPSHAATLIWTNGSGVFSDASKWDPAQAPVSGDDTIFTNGASYTVSFTGDALSFGASTFTGQPATVTLNMGAFTWNITNQLRIGRGAGSTATVYVAGGTLNCSFFSQGQIRIGDGNVGADVASGALLITNGIVVAEGINIGTSTNATGKLVISGPGVLTNTADGGSITLGGANSASTGNQLIITNGGKAFVLGEVRIGSTGTSNNLALVSGPGSVLSIGNLGVRVGAGTARGNMLIVSNGATLFTDNGGTIGGNGNGTMYNTGVVVGAGSSWISATGTTKNITIGTNTGGNSNNVLIVYNGGLLTCGGTLQLGNNAPSLSNTFNMGGSGLISTGSAVHLRFPGSSAYSVANFTNCFFFTGLMSLSGGSNNVVNVYPNATFVFSNSVALFPDTASATNNVNLDGGTQNTLWINGGTVNAMSGSNQFGVVIGSGNQVIVTNGGRFLTELGTIGAGTAFGTGIVTGVGSVWSNAGPLTVGLRTNVLIVGTNAGGSNNFLQVLNGGKLFNSGNLLIGNNPTANVNTAILGGPGAASLIEVLGAINVGASSGSYSNRLVITNATVNAGTIQVGVAGTTNNTIEIRGGTVNVSSLRVRGTNNIVFTAGTLNSGGTTVDTTANDGGPTVVGDGVNPAYFVMVAGGSGTNDFNLGGLVITNNARLRGNGVLSGVVTNLGIFEPGLSVGAITTTTHLVFGPSAVLNYELGVNSDSVHVGGSLGLGGTLNIADSGGFGPGNYTIFTYAGSLTPAGTLTVGSTPNPSLTYVIDTNTAGSVILQVTGAGGDPYTTWATFYGLSGGNAAGGADPDGDGMINTNEFLAGFNPTNSAAYLRVISVTRSGNDIVVTYLGANGDSNGSPGPKTNILEFTAGVAGNYSNNFTSAGVTNILSGGNGSGVVTNMVDVGGATNSPARYYRVRVLLP